MRLVITFAALLLLAAALAACAPAPAAGAVSGTRMPAPTYPAAWATSAGAGQAAAQAVPSATPAPADLRATIGALEAAQASTAAAGALVMDGTRQARDEAEWRQGQQATADAIRSTEQAQQATAIAAIRDGTAAVAQAQYLEHGYALGATQVSERATATVIAEQTAVPIRATAMAWDSQEHTARVLGTSVVVLLAPIVGYGLGGLLVGGAIFLVYRFIFGRIQARDWHDRFEPVQGGTAFRRSDGTVQILPRVDLTSRAPAPPPARPKPSTGHTVTHRVGGTPVAPLMIRDPQVVRKEVAERKAEAVALLDAVMDELLRQQVDPNTVCDITGHRDLPGWETLSNRHSAIIGWLKAHGLVDSGPGKGTKIIAEDWPTIPLLRAAIDAEEVTLEDAPAPLTMAQVVRP